MAISERGEMKQEELERYSIIEDKNKREIVLLRGSGCKWRKCRFCDYHLDFSLNQEENDKLNTEVLKNVDGRYERLEVINSGSFTDLSEATLKEIERVCIENKISFLHFESHWMHKDDLKKHKEHFKSLGIELKFKIGIETFDYIFRESYLVKGIDDVSSEEISGYFDECCLLFGLAGQTAYSMKRDIEEGLKNFERVCINIMNKNTMPILPDHRTIDVFIKEIYPLYKDNERVDILLNNTDFGVGGID